MASPVKRPAKNRTFLGSFVHAWRGVVAAFATEANLKRDAIATVLAVLVGWWVRLSPWQWVVLAVVCLTVIVSELWNTALESLVDLTVGERFDPLAKRIKDISAGAVLVTAVIAVICGLALFGPALWQKLEGVWH